MKTNQQICEIIGDWYLMWKDTLINWESQTHHLGLAKEHLKIMLCEPENEDREKC